MTVPTSTNPEYDAVSSLAISSDGLHLAVGFQNGWIEFWSIDPVTRVLVQGETLTIADSIGPDLYDRQVTALAFSPDGTQIAVGTISRIVQIWEVPQP
jgi:WD40 repeat protein